jgi:hypothetical protein
MVHLEGAQVSRNGPVTPPPSPELLAAMGRLAPVRTRRPLRSLGLLALTALAWAALLMAVFPLRRDLPFVAHLWWAAVALAWLAGFLVPLALAIVPPRRAVLPDGSRAAGAALATATLLLIMAFLLTPSAPPHTAIPVGMAATARSIKHCLSYGLGFALVPLFAAWLVLRRVLFVGGARLMAAAGAASGAFAGLMLHLVCRNGGAWHVGCGHGGAVLVGAAVGAAAGALLERRR